MLPAHAEVILCRGFGRLKIHNVTRTRGGDPAKGRDLNTQLKCYPHTRG